MNKKQIKKAREATEAKLRELFKPEKDGQTLTIEWWADGYAPLRIAEISFVALDHMSGSSFMRSDSNDLILRAESYALGHALTDGDLEHGEEGAFDWEPSRLEDVVAINATRVNWLRDLAQQVARAGYTGANPDADKVDVELAVAALERMATRSEEGR